MNLEKFNFIRDNYGLFSSWAVWEKEGKTPKSNVDIIIKNASMIIILLYTWYV